MINFTPQRVSAVVAMLGSAAFAFAGDIPEPPGLWAEDSAGLEIKSSEASEWLIRDIDYDREVGYNVSVAVDRVTGDTYISYYEGVDGDLWMARTGAPSGNCGPFQTWFCQPLDTTGIVGKYSSIAVGGSGTYAKIYITYYDVTNLDFKVFEGLVNRQTGGLSHNIDIVGRGRTFVDPNEYVAAGKSSAVVIDASGQPHLAFQVEDTYEGLNSVVYATRVPDSTGDCGDNDGWSCYATAESDSWMPDFIAIDLEASGDPLIAFHRDGVEEVGFAYPCGSNDCGNCGRHFDWYCLSTTSVESIGRYLSLFVEEDGTPHFAYYNETLQTIEYEADWFGLEHPSLIDAVGAYDDPAGIAMAQDGNGFPIIVYQDASGTYPNLMVARPLIAIDWGAIGNCGPTSPTGFRTWLCEELYNGVEYVNPAYGGLSIDTNAFGDATVAFRTYSTQPGYSGGILKAAIEPVFSVFVDGFESGDTSRWSGTVP